MIKTTKCTLVMIDNEILWGVARIAIFISAMFWLGGSILRDGLWRWNDDMVWFVFGAIWVIALLFAVFVPDDDFEAERD